MKTTRLGSVRVVQEATKKPWGVAEVEAELKLLQDNWVGTYQQRRGYKELCKRRDAMLGKTMRLLGEQSIAKKGKPHHVPAGMPLHPSALAMYAGIQSEDGDPREETGVVSTGGM